MHFREASFFEKMVRRHEHEIFCAAVGKRGIKKGVTGCWEPTGACHVCSPRGCEGILYPSTYTWGCCRFYSESLVSILLPPILTPMKNGSYKGEHANLSPLREYVGCPIPSVRTKTHQRRKVKNTTILNPEPLRAPNYTPPCRA